MRKSKKRDLVLDVVRQSCDHPSALTIFERARAIETNISLGTVYRNLGELASLGLVRKITTASGGDRFDKTLANHGHFLCQSCGCVIDIDKECANDIEKKLANEALGDINEIQLLCCGICNICKSKELK